MSQVKVRAESKRFVGEDEICPESYLRQIDPIWLSGPVPAGFWQDKNNRRKYLLWLGYKLRFRRMKDWYRLTHEDVKRHGGQGLAQAYWNASAIAGVKECFPEYDWKDWLFVCAPRRFWKNKTNHQRYMDWLGEQLGYRCPEDWYRVTTRDFQRHKGGAFLLCYRSSVSLAVMSRFPKYDWKEWMFISAGNNFWTSQKNRHRYMRWLGKRLGYKRPADWYTCVGKDFRENCGGECLKYYGSPCAAVKDLYPKYPWCEWMFARVPKAFWDLPKNRKRYVHWLVKKVKLGRVQDWRRIKARDFRSNCGGGLVVSVGSYQDVLRECFPEPRARRNAPANGSRNRAISREREWPSSDRVPITNAMVEILSTRHCRRTAECEEWGGKWRAPPRRSRPHAGLRPQRPLPVAPRGSDIAKCAMTVPDRADYS